MKFRILVTAAIVLLSIVAVSVYAAAPSSFSAAKRLAESQVYYDQDETFYCGCDFDFEGGPDLASCGYDVRKQPRRASRIEWEHVVPAYDIGRQRQCWQEGGRRHCRSSDPIFRQAEADLINLVPSVGEVNGDQYGQCTAKVDFEEDVFQPPTNRRGDVARTYWYMRDEYGVRISRQQQQLFTAWAKQDPVDAWETLRNQRIVAIQGSGNPYVSENRAPSQQVIPDRQPSSSSLVSQKSSAFSCSTRKTCGAMASCEEARFHLEQCGNGRLDRDSDGVPCEALCR